MKKTPFATNRSEAPEARLAQDIEPRRPGTGRRLLLVCLAFLVIALLILGWANLTQKLHIGSSTGLTTAAPRSAAASHVSQVQPPRRASALAYDSLHHMVLLFGGTLLTSNGGQTNETWTWNGSTWQQLHPQVSPPALQGTMVYDQATRQILLFLTQVQSGGKVANQMWTWDGSNWHQLQITVMPEVLNASMAYDAVQNQVVLFGGELPSSRAGALTNKTWTWNGSNWLEQHPATSPSPRAGAAMAYDAAQQQLVLYGGTTRQGISTETWLWNGATWHEGLANGGPSTRQNALLIYDEATRQTLLFGGLNQGGTQAAPADTWSWNGTAWTRIAASGAPTNLYESVAYDASTRNVTVYTVQGTLSKLAQSGASSPESQTWIWNGSTWKQVE